MSILHNQSKTIAIQNATNFTLFDIAIDSIVDAIYSNVDARDIHVYHFVGMIDDAINALEVPKSFKKKIHSAHKQWKHRDVTKSISYIFSKTCEHNDPLYYIKFSKEPYCNIGTMLESIRTKLEKNLNVIIEIDYITGKKYSLDTIKMNSVIRKAFLEVEIECDTSDSFRKIKSKIQHLNLDARIKHDINEILETNKAVYIRKLKSMQINDVYRQRKKELEAICKTFVLKNNAFKQDYKYFVDIYRYISVYYVSNYYSYMIYYGAPYKYNYENNEIVRLIIDSHVEVTLKDIMNGRMIFVKRKLPNGDDEIIVEKHHISNGDIEFYECDTMQDYINAFKIAIRNNDVCYDSITIALSAVIPLRQALIEEL